MESRSTQGFAFREYFKEYYVDDHACSQPLHKLFVKVVDSWVGIPLLLVINYDSNCSSHCRWQGEHGHWHEMLHLGCLERKLWVFSVWLILRKVRTNRCRDELCAHRKCNYKFVHTNDAEIKPYSTRAPLKAQTDANDCAMKRQSGYGKQRSNEGLLAFSIVHGLCFVVGQINFNHFWVIFWSNLFKPWFDALQSCLTSFWTAKEKVDNFFQNTAQEETCTHNGFSQWQPVVNPVVVNGCIKSLDCSFLYYYN